MWVCTSWGVLMPGLRPEGTVKEGDTQTLQVRARRKKDLQILKDKYMKDELGEIFSLPHTDYEWRAYCTPAAWGQALAKIGEDIDYVKFKETAEKQYHDHELHSLYLSMWSTIFSHLSTQKHQDDYWSWGTSLHGSVGKYGSTYPGTGNFSRGKSKKGKNRKAGSRMYAGGTTTGTGYPDYDPSMDPYAYLGKTPWWSDDNDYPYRNEDDDLGLGGYDSYLEKQELVDSLKSRGASKDDLASLFDAFEDLDPYHKPVFKSGSGNEIDHTFCDHGLSKSAKKRCRARWRRYARQRVSQAVRGAVKDLGVSGELAKLPRDF